MLRYIIKRLLQMIPLLFIISFIAFGIIVTAEHIAGANPIAKLRENPSVTKERIQQEKVRMGYETSHEDMATLSSQTYESKHKNISEDSIVVSYANIKDKDAFYKAILESLKTDENAKVDEAQLKSQVDKAVADIQSGTPMEKALESLIKDDTKRSGVVSQVKQQSHLEFVFPEYTIPQNATEEEATAAKVNGAKSLELKPGQFTYANGTFYFHSEDASQNLKFEYSTPNGFIYRYLSWIGKFLQLDMGQSFQYNTEVSKLILERLQSTVILGLSTLVVTWFIAIPLGVYLAVNQYSIQDQFFSSLSYFFMGFPDFFLAILFLLFAASTGWFPTSGMMSIEAAQSGSFATQALSVAHHLVLPTLTLSLISMASLQRRMRANLLDVLGEEYIKTARAKGVSENKVIYKHALRNAINPMVTLLGFEIAGLLSGAAFVEIIFSWPGLGNMMLQAILGSDMNLVMAGLVISSFMLLMGNLLADLLMPLVDPRIKLEA